MTSVFRSCIAAGTMTLANALPVAADISATDVKDAAISLYEKAGYAVDIGSETQNGDTIELENVTMTFAAPDGSGTVTMVYEWIHLVQAGPDVEIHFSESSKIVADINADGDNVDLNAHLDMADMQAVISGSPEDMLISVASGGGEFKIDSLVVDGKEAPLNARLGLGEIVANYAIEMGDDQRVHLSGDAAISKIDVNANMKEPDGGKGFFIAVASFANLTEVFDVDLSIAFENPEDFLNTEFDFSGSLEMGASAIDVNFQDGNDRFAMTTESESARFGFGMSDMDFVYDLATYGVKTNLTASDLPFPSINVAYDELSLSLNVPLAPAADGPSDFHARTALRGFTISEAIWSIFDPSAGIPRDPATVAIDLSGKVMVLARLLDPEMLDNMDAPPFLPVTLALNELTVAAGGANLTGSGKAKFDFSNPNTIQGFPAPDAEVLLKLKGGFGLMDKLVAIGLVPEDASMGIRAMMGAFARPVGEDDLESKIEVTPEGSILANGQRIQ